MGYETIMIKGLIFDLDGVIVDTAKYHFLAWKSLAEELGIPFSIADNERLKGVSRMASLEIILELGQKSFLPEQKEELCTRKNDLYLTYIHQMKREEIFPGVREFIENAKREGYLISLGSSSANAGLILDKLQIRELFDAIVDGTVVAIAKPEPDIFMKGAELLGLPCRQCIVFEDSVAGIEAAHRAGMAAVGIGTKELLPEADIHLSGYLDITIEKLINDIRRYK